MAKQKGPNKIKGKVGDKIYYEDKHGDHVKEVGKKPKQSKATEEAKSDFGRAQQARKLIKDNFDPLAEHCSDNCMDDRLKSVVSDAIYAGPKALRGKRAFTDGNLGLFNGFEFNEHTPVSQLVLFKPAITINPNGIIQIELPEMAIAEMFNGPRNASHAVIQFRYCGFVFDKKNDWATMPEDLAISLREDRFEGCEVELELIEDGQYPLHWVIMVGWNIRFTIDNAHTFLFDERYCAANILVAVNIKDGKIVAFQHTEPVKKEVPIEKKKRTPWKNKSD